MTLNPMTLQIASWAAYLSAAATVLTLLTGILFFTQGETFGKVNDISSIFQMVLMIPLPPVLALYIPTGYPLLTWAAAGIGLAGILLSVLGQSLLVLGRIDFQASRKFFPAGGALGLWLILVCLFGAGSGQLGGLTLWPGLLAGAGYLTTVGGFLLGGQDHPIFYLGGGMLGISYPIWAAALGKLLTSTLL
jgi:hypothetical protein